MKKQDVIRKGIAVLCVCTLTAGLWGCGTEEKSEEEKILRVVADGRLYTKAEAAAGFTEGTNSEIEVRIQRLPDEKETREIRDSENYGRRLWQERDRMSTYSKKKRKM